jgi:hypothetical protein
MQQMHFNNNKICDMISPIVNIDFVWSSTMNIKEITELIVKLHETGYWLLIPAALTALAMSRIKNIVEFFDHLSVRRLTFIKEASALEALDVSTRKVLAQELNKIVYQRVTQIRTDPLMRKRIDEIIETSKGELVIAQLTNARGHLQTTDHKLVVQIAKADKIESFLSLCLASFVIFLAITLLIAPALVLKATGLQIVVMAFLGLLLFWSAMLIASPFFTYTSAVRLKPVLARLQNQSAC